MSAMAATAAGQASVPRQRRARAAALAGEVPVWEAGHPLTLTDTMRERLRAAVHALLSAPALAAAPDVARLAAVVLMAKAPAGDPNLVVRMTTTALGTWLGVSGSTVSHTVRPLLQSKEAARTRNATPDGPSDRLLGVDWLVMPLWEARHRHAMDHPLRLTRPEFATLLRMLEALIAPGWTLKDGTVIPKGLLGKRTGHGAATDRLALLLLVLEARARGVVRLCGGAVDKHGRLVATLARLLCCPTDQAAHVLERLVAANVVEIRETRGGREQLVVPAMEDAFRQMRRLQRAEGRPQRRSKIARGDQNRPSAENPQVRTGETADCGGGDSAGLHAGHSPVADHGGNGAGCCCCSGEGRSGTGDLPGRAGAREDHATPEPQAAVEEQAPTGEGLGSPLRGEQPNINPSSNTAGQQQKAATPAPRPNGQAPTSLGRPAARPPRDLAVVLAPVQPLWTRPELGRTAARQVVAKTARRELKGVAAVTGAEKAEEVLAERLTRRLLADGGPGTIVDPIGWLIGRGLPRSSDCSDARCDEGIRMDTGTVCDMCTYRIADRRALRRRIRDQVVAELPDTPADKRQTVIEERLRQAVADEAARTQARHEQAAAEQAAREVAAEQARREAEAAERARRAQPCADCGKPEAAGLCGICREHRTTEELINSSIDPVVAAWADLTDPEDIKAVTEHLTTTFRAALADARARLKAAAATAGEDVTAEGLALATRLTAESEATQCRQSALSLLTRTEEARTESRLAAEAVMRSGHRYSSREAAGQAAATAAQKAAERTAQHLLDTRLAQLKALRTAEAPAHDVAAPPYVSAVEQVRAAARKHPRPARVEAPVRTRENASAGYRRALAAHSAAFGR